MAGGLSSLVDRTQGWEQMKVESFLRITTLVLSTFVPLSIWPNDCPKCDCHFPISDPECVKCCFFQKGTVTDSSSTSVTLAPISGREKHSAKTFQIQETTKINGHLQQGASATVYYHTVDGQDIATRIDGPGYSHGSLVPADLPNPADTCAENLERLKMLGLPIPMAAQIPADAMKIFFGDSEGYSTEQRLIVWTIGTDEILVLQKTEFGMSVSAKVRGRDGQLEAQIVDNEFFINPRNSFRIQGGGTSSLSVFDPQGQKILEIEFLNPRAIKMLGTFFGPNGEEITIGQNEQVFLSHGGKFVSSHSCFGGGNLGMIELLPTGIVIR
jgi:hypothetical protein